MSPTKIVPGLLPLLLFSTLTAQEDNLTRTFADQRAKRISEVAYRLHFELEPTKKTYGGVADLTFALASGKNDLTIDFTGQSVEKILLNEREIADFAFSAKAGAITIPGKYLEAGKLALRIEYTGLFVNTGSGFHKFTDPEDGREYHYTDFEPNDAHRMFPCFDQPDLKASYDLSVAAPADWKVIGNYPIVREFRDGDRNRTEFLKTKSFSTYLFHLSAGPFASWTDHGFRIPMSLYARQSQARFVDADGFFKTSRAGFDFFEAYFDAAYPFEKYDQIFVPEFNAGAMENVGAVTFNESFLVYRPLTESRRVRRDMVILHEMAHMWFGNLVTMTWWDDLWLNESFASYMAYKALEGIGGENVWSVASASKASAIRADERITTHPILSDVPDIRAAASIFDAITYGKGQAVLRQLDYFLGEDRFRDGLRLYFKKFAWQNTVLDDFIGALALSSGRTLDDWSAKWLKTSGVNTLQVEYQLVNDKIMQPTLIQYADNADKLIRPRATDIGLFYLNDKGMAQPGKIVKVLIEEDQTVIPELNGIQPPVFILPNYSDHDYAKVSLDPHSLAWLRDHIEAVGDLHSKTLVWRALWTMVRDQRMSPRTLLDLAWRQAPRETETQTLTQILDHVQSILDRYIPDEEARIHQVSLWFDKARDMLPLQEPGSGDQIAWYELLADLAERPDQLDYLVRLFKNDVQFEGLTMDPRRKWSLLSNLTSRAHPESERLAAEMAREDNSAYGRNYQLFLTSLKPDPGAKLDAWHQLVDENTTYSSKELTWIGRGILDENHPELSLPFVKKYFEFLPKAYKERDFNFVRRFAGLMFPYHGYEATLREADSFLKRTDTDQTLRRLVLERVDDLKRDLKIREEWNKGGKS